MKNKLFLLITISLMSSSLATAMDYNKFVAAAIGIGGTAVGTYIIKKAWKDEGTLNSEIYQTRLSKGDAPISLRNKYANLLEMLSYKGAFAGGLIGCSISTAALMLLSKKPSEYVPTIAKAIGGGSLVGYASNLPKQGAYDIWPSICVFTHLLPGVALSMWAGSDIRELYETQTNNN